MSGKKKIAVVAGLVALVAALIGGGVYNYSRVSGKEDGAPKNAVPVQIEKAGTERIVAKVSAKGTVELLNKVTLYPETQARIKTVHVKAGDDVSEGQTLISYDEEYLKEMNNELADARLALRTAQLALSAARLPAEEADVLAGENQVTQAAKTVSDSEYQIRQYDISIAQYESAAADRLRDYESKLFLYEQGVVAKSELEAAEELLREQNDRLETARSQRESALAALEAAREGLALAEKQRDALADKPNSQANLNQASQRQVQVEQARLSVERLEKDISDFKREETAAVSGTVLSVAAVEGGTAVLGTALLEIGDISAANMIVRVDVPENRAAGITEGLEVTITGDALGKDSYPGMITKVLPLAVKKQVGNSTETVIEAEARAKNPNAPIKPGFTLDVDIITRVTEKAVVVPMMALMTDDDGKDFVYVVKDDSTAEKRPVTIGAYSGMNVEAGGVAEGERVIVRPPQTVSEGVYVKPLPAAGEAAGADSAEEAEEPEESDEAQP